MRTGTPIRTLLALGICLRRDCHRRPFCTLISSLRSCPAPRQKESSSCPRSTRSAPRDLDLNSSASSYRSRMHMGPAPHCPAPEGGPRCHSLVRERSPQGAILDESMRPIDKTVRRGVSSGTSEREATVRKRSLFSWDVGEGRGWTPSPPEQGGGCGAAASCGQVLGS